MAWQPPLSMHQLCRHSLGASSLLSLQAGKAEPQGVLEVVTAKGLFCLLCVIEAAIKMTVHATQV